MANKLIDYNSNLIIQQRQNNKTKEKIFYVRKMVDFVSPKLVIIDYYDSLINQIDIYTEELIEKCQDNDLLLHVFGGENPGRQKTTLGEELTNYQNGPEMFDFFIDPYNDEYDLDNASITNSKFVPGVTRIKEYLNSLRMSAIEEIRTAQEENIRYYESIRNRVEIERNSEKIELLRSQIFSNRFCFLMRIVVENSPLSSSYLRSYPRCDAIFKLFTIVVDFYMSDEEIDLLK